MSYNFPLFQRRRSTLGSSFEFKFPNPGGYYSYKRPAPSGFVEPPPATANPWKLAETSRESFKKPTGVVEVHSASQWKVFIDDSRENNKLLVIQFTATWCGPCRLMVPAMEEFAAKYTEVMFIKIDVDKLPLVARQYDVQIMPAFALIKTGKEVEKVAGVKKTELRNKIEKHRL
ncbi:unnamed protein product [Linum trigynum]|uniref:Thioredoxin domain-containing protein n=1 Tax=Linum trigynum TaxID=586398 RepID=A0AAV2CNC0_9ROSI